MFCNITSVHQKHPPQNLAFIGYTYKEEFKNRIDFRYTKKCIFSLSINLKKMQAPIWHTREMGKFILRFRPYTLEMKHVFTVASFSRTTTPVVLIELEYDGVVGY